MKKLSEHYLFVINAVLVAGLVGVGFWIQQSNMVITPASPATPNKTSSAISVTASTTLTVGQIIPTTTPTSTIVSPKKATSTPPAILRPRENESGERYYDE